MKTVKTRNSVKSIKVLDKSANLSARMKKSFIRTKERAEETQNSRYDSPTDYASSNIQDKVQGVAQEMINHLPNPLRKANENIQRHKYAKRYFKEVKKTVYNPQTKTTQVKKTSQKIKQNIQITPNGKTTNMPNASGGNLYSVAANKNTIRERFIKNKRIKIQTHNTVKGDISQIETNIGDIKPNNSTNMSPAKNNITQNKYFKTYTLKKGEVNNKSFTNIQKKVYPAQNKKTADTSQKSSKPINISGNNTLNDSVSRSSYLNKSVRVYKNADDSIKPLDKSAKAVKSIAKNVKKTSKGTVKVAKKTIKTAEKSAKTSVKTVQQTAKTAQKTAQTSVKMAKAAAKAAKIAAKAAVKAAKATAKAVSAMTKAAIAAIKGLIAAIAAGGWVAVLVILIICLVALLVGSVFSIFFSSESDSANGISLHSVITDINSEYTGKIDDIIVENPHDILDISGVQAEWKQVLAVYTVKVVTNPDNPMEAATMNDEKVAILRGVFGDMNIISYEMETVEIEEDVLDDDGQPTGETVIVEKNFLRITVTHKTFDEIIAQYVFTDEQKEWLLELLKPEYDTLWNALLL